MELFSLLALQNEVNRDAKLAATSLHPQQLGGLLGAHTSPRIPYPSLLWHISAHLSFPGPYLGLLTLCHRVQERCLTLTNAADSC